MKHLAEGGFTEEEKKLIDYVCFGAPEDTPTAPLDYPQWFTPQLKTNISYLVTNVAEFQQQEHIFT